MKPYVISKSLCALSLLLLSENIYADAPSEVAGSFWKSNAETAPLAVIESDLPDDEDCQSPPAKDAQLVKGVVLVGDPSRVHTTNFSSDNEGLLYVDLEIPGCDEELDARLRPLYYDQPLTPELMNCLKSAITNYWADHGYPVVYVYIPEQKFTNDLLQIVVIEGTVGSVCYQGNEYFSAERLDQYVRLQPGERINRERLGADLHLINKNPFRTTNVIFSPGDKTGLTNVEIVTDDRWPWRFYTGADDTGYQETGYGRWFAGFNWGNVCNMDHILDYQFTSSNNIHEFYSHTAKYTAPLPWRHTATVFGTYSNVKGVLPNSKLGLQGMSAQASMRYVIPLKTFRSFIHEFTCGGDYKRMTDHLFSSGTEVFDKAVQILQFMAGYTLGWEGDNTQLSTSFEIYYSPGQWIHNQTRADYSSIRPGATPNYVYARAAFAPIFRLPKDFVIQLTLRGQVSSATLLSSEEFGVGGYDTVRGYAERQLNGDDAFVGNFEFRLPPFSVFFRNCKVRDTLIFLAFADYGYVWNLHNTPLQQTQGYLLGVGPGLRYLVTPYLSVRADLGYQLHQPQLFPQFSHRFHFAAVLSY